MKKLTRCAVLVALAAQPMLAAAEDDPVATAEAEQAQVFLDADSINVNDDENTVIALGNVVAKYEGRVLRSDKLIYDRDTDKVRASGNVVILDVDGTQRFADEIETDSNLNDGYAIGFSARMPNGGVTAAASAVRTADGLNALDKVIYTSCELCEGQKRPTWALRARRATLDEQAQMISYRDAVLEVGGLPVIYLPYFAHPDPSSGRRSGLLAPDFGTSSKLGLFYQQPYYWAISPYQDLTIAPQAMANVNPLMEIEYRKKFWSGAVNTQFSFTNEQDFDSDGEKFGEKEWRGHLFAEGRFDITQNWNWGFGLEQVSDDLYTRRYDIQGENETRGLYAGQPLRLLSQVFAQGQSTNWYADASVLSFEGMRDGDDDDTFPFATPYMFAERLVDFGDMGLLAVSGSSAVLNRTSGIDSQRISLASDWETQKVLPGGFLLNPFAEARYDYYDLNDTGTNADTVTRGVAAAGARLSYPLYRPGKSVDILIEPIVMGAYGTPGTNSSDIPVEDSIFYEADESTLFDANSMAGYDLYEGGSKAAIGISSTMRWKNGVSLTALGGRRWRESDDSIFDRTSNLDGNASDWVAGLSADFGNPLQLETRVRFDDEDGSLNRVDARVKTRWGRLNGQVRYYKISGDITSSGGDDEGVDLKAEVRLTDQYYFVYGRQRDIAGQISAAGVKSPGRDLRHSIGMAYEDDCSRFEIVFERSEAVDRTLGPNDSLKFRFSLKTLGDFGSTDVD